MGLAAPAGRGRLGRQRLHAGCATSSRRVGWGVRGHVAQWRPQTRGLLGCGGIELRPFPTHTCFRRLGKLPSHRRAVGPHRPVLRGVPRRPRHRVGRAPEVQPLPGVEPLLRRQPRARPRAEDPNSCCSTCPNPNCGPRCGGGCSRSSSCTPWPAPSTTGSGAASALARSTTQVNACSCLTLILACIIYWQAREISRIAAAPDFPFDPDLLRHVSPIEWNLVGTLLWDRQAGAFGCRVHRPYARRDPRRPRRGVRRGRREGAFQTSGPGENSMNRPNAAA